MFRTTGSKSALSVLRRSIRPAAVCAALLIASTSASRAEAQLSSPPQAMVPATELAGPSVTRPMVFAPRPAADQPLAFAGPTPLPPVDAAGYSAVPAAGTSTGSEEIVAIPIGTSPTGASPFGVSSFAAPGQGAGIFEPNYSPAYEGASYGGDVGGMYGDDTWTVQFFPNGLIYRSYLAGVKESRFGVQVFHEKDDGWLWDVALGGRVGLVRYGTTNGARPEGFQIDMEGAAFPRLDPESQMDLNAADFRFGIPFTYGVGCWQVKFAYYHLSSHLGDEYVFRNNLTTRFNYARDAIVLGFSYFALPSVRLYAEADWAFYQDVAEPWAFQFGAEYSPQGPTSRRGTPFVAINGHLRQELDYSGNVTVQAGWQWRSTAGHLMRIGGHYYNGLNPQYALYNDFEEQMGVGIWYDY